MVVVVQLVRTPDCGSGGRRFESGLPPKFYMIEFLFTCPYCWENQIKLVDPSVDNQSFIEDCEICCNPISFNLKITDNSITQSDIVSIEQ